MSDVEGWDCSEYKDLSDSDVSDFSYGEEEYQAANPKKKKKKKQKVKEVEGNSINAKKTIQYSVILQEENDYLTE